MYRISKSYLSIDRTIGQGYLIVIWKYTMEKKNISSNFCHCICKARTFMNDREFVFLEQNCCLA